MNKTTPIITGFNKYHHYYIFIVNEKITIEEMFLRKLNKYLFMYGETFLRPETWGFWGSSTRLNRKLPSITFLLTAVIRTQSKLDFSISTQSKIPDG